MMCEKTSEERQFSVQNEMSWIELNETGQLAVGI